MGLRFRWHADCACGVHVCCVHVRAVCVVGCAYVAYHVRLPVLRSAISTVQCVAKCKRWASGLFVWFLLPTWLLGSPRWLTRMPVQHASPGPWRLRRATWGALCSRRFAVRPANTESKFCSKRFCAEAIRRRANARAELATHPCCVLSLGARPRPPLWRCNALEVPSIPSIPLDGIEGN